MTNSFIKVQLSTLHSLKVMIFTTSPMPNEIHFHFFKDRKEPVELKINKFTGSNVINLYDLELPEQIEFGHEYRLSVTNFPTQVINVTPAIEFPEFDDMFYYDGDDLGSNYSTQETKFALWAPLASHVVLKIDKLGNREHYDLFPMKRTNKGVYRITIPGDILNARYAYIVTNDGITVETIDPYAKGASTNTYFSAVVDSAYIKSMPIIRPTNSINAYDEAIIYEVGIRDFTEQNSGSTNIVNRGKYKGFVEENRKTVGGNPAGIDYLTYLGITHVQLNPIIDFGSVGDNETKQKYNWGYDPISMFSIEGTYCENTKDSMERLIEFKEMVNKLHEKNIRVIMDVVYNHTYKHISSCYEAILPGYFFRKRPNGNLANASGCGNDIASEKPMVRKMIIDSAKYFVDTFGIDGFRFDLMGLMDITTINTLVKECKKIHSDLMFYGEGWNMGDLPFETKACSENADKMPELAFFNDAFRDIVKGSTFNKEQKGYIGGDLSYVDGTKYAVCGSCYDFVYTHRFASSRQSLNYIECHDNCTLYDKLLVSNPDDNEFTRLSRIKIANALTMCSLGIPFIHMGQEIGLSKNGLDNTYNVLDVNKMDWNLVDKRFDMVNFTKDLITLKKSFNYACPSTAEELEQAGYIFDINGILGISFKKQNNIDYKEYVIFINPSNEGIAHDLDEEYTVILDNNGFTHRKDTVKTVILPPVSVTVLGR